MDKSMNQVLREVTEDYLQNLAPDKSPAEIEAELLEAMKYQFEMHNSVADKGQKWRYPDYLKHTQIAEIILKKEVVRMICGTNQMTRRKYMILGIYNPDNGLYETEEDYFAKIISDYNYTIKSIEIKEIIETMKRKAEVAFKCMDKDLIPVNNGIFNYATKILMPFSSKYVFTAKSPVNYNPSPSLKQFTRDDGSLWDVEMWVQTLSDDPEVVNNIWEMLSAVIRPNVNWNCAAWLYGTGNNGKGCLTQLCRSLVGEENCASIPLASMSKDFALEPLKRISAIIVDENDEEYIDSASNLKTIITHDTLHINIKFEQPVQVQPHIFMVQAMNQLPRTSSRSGNNGFYRRQLFIPLDKCFDGHEDKKIKREYLKDSDTLEYILHKVLNTDFYEFTETAANEELKEEYKVFNNPVRQFYDEFITQTVWNFLPGMFLYDAYKVWFGKNNPSGKPQGRNTFLSDLKELLVKEVGGFEYRSDKNPIHSSQTNLNEPEYLIQSYDLKDWMNPSYKGNDWKQRCVTIPRKTMSGFLKLYPMISDEKEDK